MKPRAVLIWIVLIGFFSVSVWWFFFDGGERWSANRIVGRIENYRYIHGRLPDPEDTALLQTLGFELRVGLHPEYRLIGPTDYVITILLGFDGPYWYYESRTESWHQGYSHDTIKSRAE